jgi:predicted O-methyltransferase YrrM
MMATTPVMEIVPPYTPELLYEVVKTLHNHVVDVQCSSVSCKVLELGSGWSTLWFSNIGCNILSIEHDVDWFLEVNKKLFENRLEAHLLYLNPTMIENTVNGLNPDYDIILIDCIDELRIPCLKIARYKIRKRGWIVVDDTHWEEMKPVAEIMKGWQSRVIKGIHTRKTGEVKEHETTIFYR